MATPRARSMTSVVVLGVWRPGQWVLDMTLACLDFTCPVPACFVIVAFYLS